MMHVSVFPLCIILSCDLVDQIVSKDLRLVKQITASSSEWFPPNKFD